MRRATAAKPCAPPRESPGEIVNSLPHYKTYCNKVGVVTPSQSAAYCLEVRAHGIALRTCNSDQFLLLQRLQHFRAAATQNSPDRAGRASDHGYGGRARRSAHLRSALGRVPVSGAPTPVRQAAQAIAQASSALDRVPVPGASTPVGHAAQATEACSILDRVPVPGASATPSPHCRGH